MTRLGGARKAGKEKEVEVPHGEGLANARGDVLCAEPGRSHPFPDCVPGRLWDGIFGMSCTPTEHDHEQGEPLRETI
jgi:hypothetical protein